MTGHPSSQNRRELLTVLHGGDGRLADLLGQMISAAQQIAGLEIFRDKSIAYVAIGLEPLIESGKLSRQSVQNAFESVIQPAFKKAGSIAARLIWTADLDTIFKSEIVVLSGGETAHLLKVLEEADTTEKLKSGQHSIEVLMGISAGAIALAEAGIGTEGGKVSRFTGMGIMTGCIRPHADTHPERSEMVKDATPLGAFAVARFVEV